MTHSRQDPISNETDSVHIPDLGTGEKPIELVHWLVDEGAQVISGERVAELLADSVLFYLEVEQTGELSQIQVGAGTRVEIGQAVATIAVAEES
ncbi:branched-chain alpha-keto acid dehydrogenase subunit E2 [Thalassoglobus neptunius]|uniref:Branched-chain alpha-keto acid dehydrogenase subunit E2 n=1 Tax=Thalassoglobus neptunius TaxID=1938619 RepID=A0A5C5X144_9PLAN|nr:lipoyl domain-containing protein [Thalassoglobus neptunius]TWT56864.1 branched-chain alpha-keto acid dehydrogenase subunit E2 [Thalassoglobus neptunius]